MGIPLSPELLLVERTATPRLKAGLSSSASAFLALNQSESCTFVVKPDMAGQQSQLDSHWRHKWLQERYIGNRIRQPRERDR